MTTTMEAAIEQACREITAGRHFQSQTMNVQLRRLEQRTAEEIQLLLEDFFKGHHFMIRISLQKTMPYVMIGLDGFHDSTYGKFINIRNMLSEPNELRRKVMEAGGEMLERFGLTRGKANVDAYLDLYHPMMHRMTVPD